MSKPVNTCPHPNPRALPSLLGMVLLLFAAAVVIGITILSLRRVFYPYTLDFIEDAMLLQSWRYARALPVYLPPNGEFVPQVYMPLYAWLGGWLLRLTGPVFWPLRLFSWLCSVGTAVLITCNARRLQPYPALAAASGALFLAGFRLVGGWHDLVRVDPLFTLLVLGGMTMAVIGRHHSPGPALAGALLGLALLTKQNGLFLSAVTGGWLLLAVGRRAGWFWLVWTAVVLPPILWLENGTGGWFSYYVVDIAYASPVDPARIGPLLQREFIGGMGGLLLAATVSAFFLLRRFRPREWRAWLADERVAWLLFSGATTFVSLAGRTSVGGNLNNLIIGFALLCLAPALLASWPVDGRLVSGLLLVQALLVLFPPLPYAPTRYWPTTEMIARGDRLVAEIAAVEGEVWVMLLPQLALQAGKEPGVHIQTLWHARMRGAQPLPPDLVEQIEEQVFARVISTESDYFEQEAALQTLLREHYQPQPLDPTLALPTLSGIPVQPKIIFSP